MTTAEYVAILEEAADNWADVLAEPVSLTARICRTQAADGYGRGNAA